MSNVVRFPTSGRLQAATIPREEFQRLADLALDVVDQIVAILDRADGDTGLKDGGDAEPALGAPEKHTRQVAWLRGSSRDLEIRPQPKGPH